jgi:hypothetical protein
MSFCGPLDGVQFVSSIPQQNKAIHEGTASKQREVNVGSQVLPPTVVEQSKAIHDGFNSNKELAVFVRPVSNTKSREFEQLMENGYVILRNLLAPQQMQAMRENFWSEVQKERNAMGRNRFEGEHTYRVYGLLGKSRVYDCLAEHARVMSICDELLLPNYLVTASQGICICPGSPHQPYHYDDSFCFAGARPRQPFSVAVICAIDAFTAENGATLIFPKSHLWGEGRVPTGGLVSCSETVVPCNSRARRQGHSSAVRYECWRRRGVSVHFVAWRRTQCD